MRGTSKKKKKIELSLLHFFVLAESADVDKAVQLQALMEQVMSSIESENGILNLDAKALMAINQYCGKAVALVCT